MEIDHLFEEFDIVAASSDGYCNDYDSFRHESQESFLFVNES